MLVSKKARESLTTNHDQMLRMRVRCTMRSRFNGMAEGVPNIQVDRGRDCDMRQNARYNPVFWWETTRTRPVTINIVFLIMVVMCACGLPCILVSCAEMLDSCWWWAYYHSDGKKHHAPAQFVHLFWRAMSQQNHWRRQRRSAACFFNSYWSCVQRMLLVFLEQNVVLYTRESIGEMEGQIMYYTVASSFLPCFCVKHETLLFLPFQILEWNWPGRDMANPVWVYQWLVASSMQGCLGICLIQECSAGRGLWQRVLLGTFFVVNTENIRLVCFVIYVFLQRVES